MAAARYYDHYIDLCFLPTAADIQSEDKMQLITFEKRSP
jgi:hypothetical protein